MDIDETDNENKDQENQNGSEQPDLSKFEQNLQRTEDQDDNSKMLELLNKQDATITQLKAEIKNLKELNMTLALSAGTKNEPQSAVDALNSAFKK